MESKSYSSVTQSFVFPTKDQAVIVDAIDDMQIKDYAYAFGKIIDPTKIRFLSRMSNNRVCLFVSTKEVAEELTDIHQCIVLNNTKVPIRPLMTKNKRIILSNVCPIIPHTVIEAKLAEMKIELASPVSFVRAGITESGFSHILSFRRQAYVSPDIVNNLPDRIQVDFDGTSYWIYVSTDSMTCFLCKKEGHVANKCPGNAKSNENPKPDNISETLNVPYFRPPVTFKRPHPPTMTDSLQSAPAATELLLSDSEVMSESDSSEVSIDDSSSAKKIVKKQKMAIDLQPSEIKEIEKILECGDYPMSIKEFMNFLDESYGKENILQISLTYTDDIGQLVKILKEVIQEISARKVKNRITRMIKKLSTY